MRYGHELPFGAAVERPSQAPGVRFRLYAPAAAQVALVLEEEAAVPMPAVGDGWFELASLEARAGSRYRFRIDDAYEVADPAARAQAADVHGPSLVVDPYAYEWQDAARRGRPWAETVIYELHVGTLSASGDFAGVVARLDELRELGITAIELMPVADFPGRRNWGYDGVLPFAPDRSYGTPEELKRLIDAAHARGLQVFLDVVYNHLGPEGNVLARIAPTMFRAEATPWGPGIDFSAHFAREYFIHNALYWLTEYRLDGLRLDAVHAMRDDTEPHILAELAQRVAQGPGATRTIHLMVESGDIVAAAPHALRGYTAEWHDALHHALRMLLTGEREGYRFNQPGSAMEQLARALAVESPARAIAFLQNHDQVGNRAPGLRIAQLADTRAVRAATALVLLAPFAPLLFMGQEWAATSEFPFFCDFVPALGEAVYAGRVREFARFPEFRAGRMPHPNLPATFTRAILDWHERLQGEHAAWWVFHRNLLACRRRELAPRLPARFVDSELLSARALTARWRLADGSQLSLLANLSGENGPSCGMPSGLRLYPDAAQTPIVADRLAPWTVLWSLDADV